METFIEEGEKKSACIDTADSMTKWGITNRRGVTEELGRKRLYFTVTLEQYKDLSSWQKEEEEAKLHG